MTDASPTPVPRYKNPPVIERVLTVTADFPVEHFIGRLDHGHQRNHAKMT